MQLEFLVVGAIWFCVFYFVNKGELSRIEELRSNAEDYTINETEINVIVQRHLIQASGDEPINKATFIAELFDILKPHVIIIDSEKRLESTIRAGIGLMIFSLILSFWPKTSKYNMGNFLFLRYYAVLFCIAFAFFLLLDTLKLQQNYKTLKKSLLE